MSVVFEAAHLLGLVPLGWLALRRERRPLWWWLAGAFAISWVADTVAHVADPWLINALYPVSQAGIIAVRLLPRREANFAVGLLIVAALCVLWLEGVAGPDVLLETVAAGVVVISVWRYPAFRWSLVTAFGGGWLAWMGYLLAPGWAGWGVYQGCRALGIGMFCWASTRRTG